MKKIISLILAAFLLLNLYPAVIFAQGAVVTLEADKEIGANTILTAVMEDPQAVSYEYQWLAGDNEGTYRRIKTATTQTYHISTMDKNQYLNCRITPVYEDGSRGAAQTAAQGVFVETLGTVGEAKPASEVREAAMHTPEENKFSIQGSAREYVFLDEFDDADSAFYIMADYDTGIVEMDTAADPDRMDPSSPTNLAYWLNNSYGKDGYQIVGVQKDPLEPAIYQHVNQNHVWWCESGITGHTGENSEDYSFTAGISVLSQSEALKYYGVYGWSVGTEHAGWNLHWWTRSGGGPESRYVTMQNAASLNELSGCLLERNLKPNSSHDDICPRPVFFLKEDFFAAVKLDISKTGDKIKKAIRNRYEAEELQGLYTAEELSALGFGATELGASIVPSTLEVRANTILTASYYDPNAVSYEYQWLSGDREDNCSRIKTAKAQTYHVSTMDKNKYLNCQITPVYSDGTKGIIQTAAQSVFVEQLGTVGEVKPEADVREAGQYTPAENQFALPNPNPEDTESYRNYILLDEFDDPDSAFYIMADYNTGIIEMDKGADPDRLDPSSPTNLAYWLNHDYAQTGYEIAGWPMKPLETELYSHVNQNQVWWCESGITGHTGENPEDYSFTAGISILSQSEALKYYGVYGWSTGTNHAGWFMHWCTRSGGGPESRYLTLQNTAEFNDLSGCFLERDLKPGTGHDEISARPVFFLKEDFFTSVKLDLSKTGDNVKKAIRERYDAEALKGIYTAEELHQIGYDVGQMGVSLVADTPVIGANTTLTASYYDANAVSYEYQWMSGTQEGAYSRIKTATKSTYYISTMDKNQYLNCQVTPVYADGTKGAAKTAFTGVFVERLGTVGEVKLSLEERTAAMLTPVENKFSISGSERDYVLLDEFDDTASSFYVLADYDTYPAEMDQTDASKMDPSRNTNMAYFLNHDFVTTGYSIAGVSKDPLEPAIYKHVNKNQVWWCESGITNHAGDNPQDYSFTAGIGILSQSEALKYFGTYGWHVVTEHAGWNLHWWTRSGGGPENRYVTMQNAGEVNELSGCLLERDMKPGNGHDEVCPRPAFFLDDGFFRSVKLDLTRTGDNVKKVLTSRYTKGELSKIYNFNELELLGFPSPLRVDRPEGKLYTPEELYVNLDYTAEDGPSSLTVEYGVNNTVVGTYEYEEFLWPDDRVQQKIPLTGLPYGAQDVTITLKIDEESVGSLAERMYIIPQIPEDNGYDFERFGICTNIQDEALLRMAAKLGFKEVRSDFMWTDIERENGEKGVYDFSRFENGMKVAGELGIEPLALLCYNNSLYTSNYKNGVVGQENRTAFVNYAKALVEHFPQLKKVEVWNEPNAPGFWGPQPDVAEYVKLVQEVSAAVKAVNPDIQVYAGAIDVSKQALEFVNGMFTNGCYDSMDALSYHPYYAPQSIGDFEQSRPLAYRPLLYAQGGFKELTATEIGYNSTVSNPEKQARETVKSIVVSNAYGTTAGDIYNLKDTVETYGLMTKDGVPTPQMFSVVQMNSALAGAKFLGRLPGEEGVSAYVYVKNNKPLVVAWSTGAGSISFGGSGVQAFDLNGNPAAVSNGTVALDEAPKYIEQVPREIMNQALNYEMTLRKDFLLDSVPLKQEIAELLLSSPVQAKKKIMADEGLTQVQKSAALYGLHEINQVKALYNSTGSVGDIQIPTQRYQELLAQSGSNAYAKAALRQAKKYLEEAAYVAAGTESNKEQLLAYTCGVVKELLDSAQIMLTGTLEEGTVAVKDAAVADGKLRFIFENTTGEAATVHAAIYDGEGRLVKVFSTATPGEAVFEVGTGYAQGKLMVWNAAMKPVVEKQSF